MFLVCLVATGAFAEPNKLVIATLEYPPFITTGPPVGGPVVDRVRSVFARLGVEVDIVVYPIARGLSMVETGKVDAYFSLKRTPERERILLFTRQPLVTQTFVFFARADSKITWTGRMDELRNRRIGVVSSTSYGPLFDRAAKELLIHLDEANTFEQNLAKLIAGRVDLVINSLDVGRELVQRLGAEDQVIALVPPSSRWTATWPSPEPGTSPPWPRSTTRSWPGTGRPPGPSRPRASPSSTPDTPPTAG